MAPANPTSRYVPALRFHALTWCYDAVVAVTTREATHRKLLLESIEATCPSRILDLGCGTGSLAIMAVSRHPHWTMIGVDVDPEILAIAGRKADRAGVKIEFINAPAHDLGSVKTRVDVVVSSLLFHHLDGAGKRAALTECLRLLRPGGKMYLLDWSEPQDVLMSICNLAVRMLDGFANTRDNVEGLLPGMMREAGFDDVRTQFRMRTPLGSLALLSGVRPTIAADLEQAGDQKA